MADPPTLTAAAPSARRPCYVKGCPARAPYTPVLHLAHEGKERTSRVALPVQLCRAHRSTFPRVILSVERRADMERSLQLRGRLAPDWTRTTLEFVGP